MWHLRAGSSSFWSGESQCIYRPYLWFEKVFQAKAWISRVHLSTSPPKSSSSWCWSPIGLRDSSLRRTNLFWKHLSAFRIDFRLHTLRHTKNQRWSLHRSAIYQIFINHESQRYKISWPYPKKHRFSLCSSLASWSHLTVPSRLRILLANSPRFFRQLSF